MRSPLNVLRLPLAGLLAISLGAPALAGKPGGDGGTETPPPVTYDLSVYSAPAGMSLFSINENGAAAGYKSGSPPRPVVILPNGDAFDLTERVDSAVWDLRSAFAINSSNQIAGTAYPRGGRVAYRYSPEMIDPESGATISAEVIERIYPSRQGVNSTRFDIGGINEWGDVAMFTSVDTPYDCDIFVFAGAPGLGGNNVILSGRTYYNDPSINVWGQIAGTDNTNDEWRAFRYTQGQPLEWFASLGPVNRSHARDINDLGEWAGNALGSQKVKGVYQRRAVRCSGTTLEDLGTLGGSESDAYAINNSGVVVGRADTTNGTEGFVFIGGKMYSLRALIAPESLPANLASLTPNDINDDGQICGDATFTDSNIRGGFVLTPIGN